MVVVQSHLVVDVHETSLYLLERFDLVLQENPTVMAVTQRRGLWHHDLQLHKVLWPEVVGRELVKLHSLVVALDDAENFLQEVWVCFLADNHLHLLKPCEDPGVDDVNGNPNACQGIDHPELVAQDDHLGSNEGRDVGDHIVHVVLRDGLDCIDAGVALCHVAAPVPQSCLEENDEDKDYDGSFCQSGSWGIIAIPVLDKLYGRLADNLHGSHAHDHGTNHDTNWLQPSPPNGILFVARLPCQEAGQHQGSLSQEVDDGVHQRGQDSQRARDKKCVQLA
mmetsp:Transcript_26971/g.63338  ORF Transcript_26971/g.63338 Transcript_26971/m.63338 type:complete len:279 (+) Transcript_26971:228-1064(+)